MDSVTSNTTTLCMVYVRLVRDFTVLSYLSTVCSATSDKNSSTRAVPADHQASCFQARRQSQNHKRYHWVSLLLQVADPISDVMSSQQSSTDIGHYKHTGGGASRSF
uniref:Uncharacterized protein n=1 Tax=Haptolina ericina TaxID=156174 RepID=A0A7S3F3U3_9EUKA